MPASAASWAPDNNKKEPSYFLKDDAYVYKKVRRAEFLLTYGLTDGDSISAYSSKLSKVEDDIKDMLRKFVENYKHALTVEQLNGTTQTEELKKLLEEAAEIDIMLECHREWPRSL